MAVKFVSKPQEDFIVQINGDYNVPFDELIAPKDVVAGELVEIGFRQAIAATNIKSGAKGRFMVRGNPTSVNRQAIIGDTDAVAFALESVGIIVVNN